MNKFTRLILLIPVLALTACGTEDPKKPASNSTGPVTSSTAATSGEVFYRALSLEEVKECFFKMNETIVSTKTIQTQLTKTTYEVVDEVLTPTVYSIDIDTKLFNNSIVFASYKADTVDSYKEFGFYSDEDGARVERYVYIDNTFENINTVLVYSKTGEANRKNVLTQVPYSITTSDAEFTIGTQIILPDVDSDYNKISIAAELANGNYQVRFTSKVTAGDMETIIHKTYVAQDDYLLYYTEYCEINTIVSEEEKTPVMNYNYRYDHSYSPNGDFERSSLPEIS